MHLNICLTSDVLWATKERTDGTSSVETMYVPEDIMIFKMSQECYHVNKPLTNA